MAIQDLATAREECVVCISKWQTEMESIKALIVYAPAYSAAAFAQSVNARMPALQRCTRATLVRISILIQAMEELEAEKAVESGDQ
jgi:hypothetical protein